MTAIHDQAMHHIYRQVLERLLSHMSQSQRASLQLLIQRLLITAGGAEYIGTFRLLVLHGNDRRSARLLAMLRAAQLCIAMRGPVTFQLRVLVISHPAPCCQALECHDRAFSALFLHEDPRVELLMVRNRSVIPFSRDWVPGKEDDSAAGKAMLLFGHFADATPEALLGARLYLELAATFTEAMQAQALADAMITALPARQRHRFMAWVRRILHLAGENGSPEAQHCLAALAEGLSRLAGKLEDIGGDQTTPVSREPSGRDPLRVLSIDEFLAHLLEGQKLDSMLGRPYASEQDAWPLGAYVDPEAVAQLGHLQSRVQQAQEERPVLTLTCQWDKSSRNRPGQATRALGLSHDQLMCLLFKPFTHRGEHLERFLKCRHTDMLVALPYLHQALRGQACPHAVKAWLVNVSGLQIAQLRVLYETHLPGSPWRVLNHLARRDINLRLLRKASAQGSSVESG
nr:hypothetical protein [uncultured Pseudomonas sp.]